MQKQELDFSNDLDSNRRFLSCSQPQARCLPSGVYQIVQPNNSLVVSPRPAVFLDRDGTINAERGYLCDPEAVALLPTVCEALSLLNNLSIPTIVITNQSALGRGLMSWDEFDAVSAKPIFNTWRNLIQCSASGGSR